METYSGQGIINVPITFFYFYTGKSNISCFQCLYSSISSFIYNYHNTFDIDAQKVESTYKFYDKFYAPTSLCTPVNHSNNISVLQNCIKNSINGKRETESLPMMKSNNLKNLVTKVMSSSQSKVNAHKNFRNIDKKILKYMKRLCPPSKQK